MCEERSSQRWVEWLGPTSGLIHEGRCTYSFGDPGDTAGDAAAAGKRAPALTPDQRAALERYAAAVRV